MREMNSFVGLENETVTSCFLLMGRAQRSDRVSTAFVRHDRSQMSPKISSRMVSVSVSVK